MNKYENLAKRSLLILVGGTLSKCITFFFLPFYTKYLNPSEFGESDLIYTYSSLLISLITLSIAEAIFIFPKTSSIRKKCIYYSSGITYTFVLLCLWAIIFGGVSILLKNYGIDNIITRYPVLVYLIIISTFIQTYTQQFACAINNIKVYSYAGVVYAVSLAILSIFLIPKYRLYGYIYSMLLSSFISSVYTFIFSAQYRYYSINHVDKKYYAEMLKYSIPLIPNGMMWWIVSFLNRPILEYNLPLSSIGIYAVANKIPSLVSLVFQFFANSWIVSIAEEYKKPGFNNYFNNILKFVSYGLTFLSLVIILFGKEIIELITSDEFYDCYIYMPILTLSVLLSCIGSFVGCIFGVVKKSKYFLYSTLVGGIIAIACNALLIPKFGLWGATISTLLSFASITIIRIFFTRKFVMYTDIFYYFYLILILILTPLLLLYWFDSFLLKMIILFVLNVIFIISERSFFYQIYNRIKKLNLKR